MSDNVVALRETTAENPMRQQILDYVAQVLDETPDARGIIFTVVGRQRQQPHWFLPSTNEGRPWIAFAGALLTNAALQGSFDECIDCGSEPA